MDNDLKALKPVSNLEQAVDNLQTAITQYLVELSQKPLSQEESEEIPVLIHSVNDIERIGDHAENILELSERKVEKKLPFTVEADKEVRSMWNELHSMMLETEEALRKNDISIAERVLNREQRINQFQVDLKKSHVRRLNKVECDLKSGIVFMDFVDNLEKIGDHLTNIAQAVVGDMKWKGYLHEEKLAEDSRST